LFNKSVQVRNLMEMNVSTNREYYESRVVTRDEIATILRQAEKARAIMLGRLFARRAKDAGETAATVSAVAHEGNDRFAVPARSEIDAVVRQAMEARNEALADWIANGFRKLGAVLGYPFRLLREDPGYSHLQPVDKSMLNHLGLKIGRVADHIRHGAGNDNNNRRRLAG
jgi:hypothetical protein